MCFFNVQQSFNKIHGNTYPYCGVHNSLIMADFLIPEAQWHIIVSILNICSPYFLRLL